MSITSMSIVFVESVTTQISPNDRILLVNQQIMMIDIS